MRTDVRELLDAYPRIYFACHRRHVHDPATGAVVSRTQSSILDHLDRHDPTSLNDLAAHMGVTPGTMSVAIDRLLRAGYVTRERHPVDGRRVLIRVTDAGERVKQANSVLDPDLVARLLDELPSDERRAALDGLASLARAATAAARQSKADGTSPFTLRESV
jgi:DNA-binding MarR family transcriptional regulator